MFVASLQAGRRLETHKGIVFHDDIIGKRPRDLVSSKPIRSLRPGVDFRVHEARLDEYVRLTRRLVTPLYPQDAHLIVGLLDLHPDPPAPDGAGGEREPAIEILEAGTGHGALTLYLSRAIHAANPARPRSPCGFEASEGPAAGSDDLTAWKAGRRAIIHSVEISAKTSAHAARVVQGFRRGLYADNVDFHVGDVRDWVVARLSARKDEPFLSHAFLDLPGSDDQIATVASALRSDGALIVFNPSITQIIDCLEKVKREGLQLDLERVVELGVNGGSGGREWDVRAVRPRAAQKLAMEKVLRVAAGAESGGEDSEAVRDGDAASIATDEGLSSDTVEAGDTTKEGVEWKMVCRPRVGEMVVGGGFLGVFRKKRPRVEPQPDD